MDMYEKYIIVINQILIFQMLLLEGRDGRRFEKNIFALMYANERITLTVQKIFLLSKIFILTKNFNLQLLRSLQSIDHFIKPFPFYAFKVYDNLTLNFTNSLVIILKLKPNV